MEIIIRLVSLRVMAQQPTDIKRLFEYWRNKVRQVETWRTLFLNTHNESDGKFFIWISAIIALPQS